MRQRSTRTLFTYWNDIRGPRSAPDRRDVDPSRIRDALAYTFILQSEDGIGFEFRLAGSHLCASYCRELKGRSFSGLWNERDRDALETLMKAVTEDHAVALLTFDAITERGEKLGFETMLLPLRHNGVTNSRIMGAMSAVESPYWLGIHPIAEQRITGLRLIWPDEDEAMARSAFSDAMVSDLAANSESARSSSHATISGLAARRYAHLSVIDGGRA